MTDRLPIDAEINPPKKRRVFFSFCYDEDVNRANVVLNSWRIHNPDSILGPSFVDSSIWEKAKARGDENVMRLIREGVDQTSVTCVLVGAHTWERRWVRYEIARSVERGNGLFAVRINGITDTTTLQTSVAGRNPLAYMGAGKVQADQYFIFENISGQWFRYKDYTPSVGKPSYLPDMSVGYVQALSVGLFEYDYMQHNGSKNLGAWVDLAAQKAGT